MPLRAYYITFLVLRVWDKNILTCAGGHYPVIRVVQYRYLHDQALKGTIVPAILFLAWISDISAITPVLLQAPPIFLYDFRYLTRFPQV